MIGVAGSIQIEATVEDRQMRFVRVDDISVRVIPGPVRVNDDRFLVHGKADHHFHG